MMKNSVKNLIEFIDHSQSCFHVIENARKQFMDHGFIELKEKEYWNLEEGKSYFVTRNGSSFIAFHLPKKDFQGFHIVASHSDSPTYRIKEQPEMRVENHCGGRFLFSGAEPYIRQQHFRPWHRAVQFCAAALVGHYDDPERRASHHRVLYLRQRIWRKDRIHQCAAAGVSGAV